MSDHVGEWSRVYMPPLLPHHPQLDEKALSRAWYTISVMIRHLVYDSCDAIDSCTFRLVAFFAAVEMFKRVASVRRLVHPRELIYNTAAASVAVFAVVTDGPEDCDIDYPNTVVACGNASPWARRWFSNVSPVSATDVHSTFHECCFYSTLRAAGWYSCGGVANNPFLRWYHGGGNQRPADIRYMHKILIMGELGTVQSQTRDAVCCAVSDDIRWTRFALPSVVRKRKRDEEAADPNLDGDDRINTKRGRVC